jgi:hypothetical protein
VAALQAREVVVRGDGWWVQGSNQVSDTRYVSSSIGDQGEKQGGLGGRTTIGIREEGSRVQSSQNTSLSSSLASFPLFYSALAHAHSYAITWVGSTLAHTRERSAF